MTDSLRSNFDRRRYRLAHVVVMFGSLAVGLLLLSQLYELLRGDFQAYYGVVSNDADVHVDDTAAFPLTMMQLTLAFSALIGVFWFIGSERRRVRASTELDRAARARSAHVVVERPGFVALFDEVVVRASAFAGFLLAGWLLQTSLERRLGGLGWGIDYVDWRSLLPLASVFGLSVIVGLVVASISLVGLRAIHVLEVVLARIGLAGGLRRVARIIRSRSSEPPARTLRELIGCDILSRPPPCGAAGAPALAC